MTDRADSRRIVVTGATRGLGRALVEGFAAGGHAVSGCGRSADAIDELGREHGAPHDFRIVDVADDEAVARWAQHVLDLGPAPDLVVNNAGVIHENAVLWELPDSELARVLDVNVRGTANVARHFLPAMISAGRGVLANMTSTWGRTTAPEVSGYCASKWAVEGMTQALSQELPHGVAAVAVNPGVIDTQMLRRCFGDGAAGHITPVEWARRAVPFFLALGVSDNGDALSIR